MTSPTQTQIRRDAYTNILAATPAQFELAGDVTYGSIRIGDGATAGGKYVTVVANGTARFDNNGAVNAQIWNDSSGPDAQTNVQITDNNGNSLYFGMAGSGWTTAVITGGPIGECGYLFETGAIPLAFATNSAFAGMFDASGRFLLNYDADQGGHERLQVNSGAFVNGNLHLASGNFSGLSLSNGNGYVGAGGTAGLSLLGKGATYDIELFGSASGNPLILGVPTGTTVLQFGAGSFTANGTTSVSLTAVAPAGAHATVQEWLTVQDASGNTRYIPAF